LSSKPGRRRASRAQIGNHDLFHQGDTLDELHANVLKGAAYLELIRAALSEA
jgi:hypothetical protein